MENYGLPDGVSLSQVLAVLIPVGIVTVVLRQLPFSFIKVMRGSPLVGTLAMLMPVGVMVILVVYSFSGVLDAGVLPAVIGVFVTSVLHVWRHQMLISIVGGVGAYGLALLIF